MSYVPMTPFELVRDVTLPSTNSAYDAVRVISRLYERLTHRYLDQWDALRIYDRIRAERAGQEDVCSPRPIPEHLMDIAGWLLCHDYDFDAMNLVIRELEKNGTVENSQCLDGEDRDEISRMLEATKTPVGA